MAEREEIEMDFRQAMRKADEIDRVAERLSRVAVRQFGDNLQNLAVSWKGESASQFLRKAGSLQQKMDGTAGRLHAAASDVRTVAKRLYDAEMAALAVAAARTY